MCVRVCVCVHAYVRAGKCRCMYRVYIRVPPLGACVRVSRVTSNVSKFFNRSIITPTQKSENSEVGGVIDEVRSQRCKNLKG